MKFRYVIEKDGEGTYALSEATPTDPNHLIGSSGYQIAELKEIAQKSTESFDQDAILVWKDPPESWGSDVLAVSQYLDDGVEENRDS